MGKEKAADEELLNLMHDLRRLGGLLQTNVHELRPFVDRTNAEARTRLDAIEQTANFIRKRLDIVDIQLNPELWMQQDPVPRPLHAEFISATTCLRERAREKNISVKYENTTDATIAAYPFFGMLALLLLENAIKYSPKTHEISIRYEDDPSSRTTTVSMRNYGPKISEQECTQIFQDKFRGENAKLAVANGEGRGLKIAAFVAQLHGGDIAATCGPEHSRVASIPYALVSVSAKLPWRENGHD
jgi:K+-sensing histidine kinase KdpD